MHELLRHRDLIRALVIRDLKVRYRRSTIGFLWTMLNPLLTMTVLQVVFSSLFRFEVASYPAYVLSGLIFWNFFSQSIVASMNSLRGNASLLQKFPVPKAVFPLATVISGMVNLVFALLPLLAILVATGHPLHPSLVVLPLSLVIASLFTLGAGLLLSPLALFFTDTVEIVSVGLTLVLYMTPVFYPVSIVPESFRRVIVYNPVGVILRVFRDPIYSGTFPIGSDLAIAAGVSTAMLALGAAVFRRSSDSIPFYL